MLRDRAQSGTETAGADPEKSDGYLSHAGAAAKKESELKRSKAADPLPSYRREKVDFIYIAG